MRRILRDPRFQALESAWRAAHWLVTNLETDETLQVHLLDVGKDELAADIAGAGDDLERSALYRLLMQHGPGMPDGPAWSVLAGDYRFGAGADDVALLAALGAIGAQVGGPFLAEADASILGCRSLAESPDDRRWERLDDETAARWSALRQSKAAPWLGLALPRVLLRVPYGRKSDPIEQFAFEEMPGGAYLWGSPAIACALLLGQAYSDAGPDMTPGDRQELTDLPCYTSGEAGERVMTPCAEVALSERTANAILDRGLMPALGFANRNAVRIARFQSLADPPTALSGPWA
jgi:type VI secretion system protein ImpC